MYSLRKTIKKAGFYFDLHTGRNLIQDASEELFQDKQRASNRGLGELSKNIRRDIRKLNSKILKNLRSSVRKSPEVKDKFKASHAFVEYVTAKYGGRTAKMGRFMESSILSDHSFQIERFFNNRDYCTVYENSFLFRLQKPKKYIYKIDHNLSKFFKFSQTKQTFHFKFVIHTRKVK
jgi:hypothetical protein